MNVSLKKILYILIGLIMLFVIFRVFYVIREPDYGNPPEDRYLEATVVRIDHDIEGVFKETDRLIVQNESNSEIYLQIEKGEVCSRNSNVITVTDDLVGKIIMAYGISFDSTVENLSVSCQINGHYFRLRD